MLLILVNYSKNGIKDRNWRWCRWSRQVTLSNINGSIVEGRQEIRSELWCNDHDLGVLAPAWVALFASSGQVVVRHWSRPHTSASREVKVKDVLPYQWREADLANQYRRTVRALWFQRKGLDLFEWRMGELPSRAKPPLSSVQGWNLDEAHQDRSLCKVFQHRDKIVDWGTEE